MNYINKPDNNVHDIEELCYHNNFIEVTDIVRKWQEAKPDNQDIKKVVKNLTEIGIYVMQMQKRQRYYDDQISKRREENNRLKLINRENERTIKHYETLYK